MPAESRDVQAPRPPVRRGGPRLKAPAPPRPQPAAATTAEELQQQLGHQFTDLGLLRRALTHKSFGSEHNERLEFLGDAVLSAGVSVLLYRSYPQADEGELSRVRAHLVREESLHQIAVELGLPTLIRLSEGEARSGGAQRASILADALEALIGAVQLDAGLAAAAAMVERLIGPHLDRTATAAWTKDPKTELQEWLQARREPVPSYRIAATLGREHDQTFVVACAIPTRQMEVQGQGRSRRAAEQAAAQLALDNLKGL